MQPRFQAWLLYLDTPKGGVVRITKSAVASDRLDMQRIIANIRCDKCPYCGEDKEATYYLRGGNYRQDVGFILFDVVVGTNYQPRESVEDIAKCFGLEIVPIVITGTIDEAVAFVKSKPDSTFGNAKMEGVVGRPRVELRDRCGRRVIVKIKVADFT